MLRLKRLWNIWLKVVSNFYCRPALQADAVFKHQLLFSNTLIFNNYLCGFVVPRRRPEEPTYKYKKAGLKTGFFVG